MPVNPGLFSTASDSWATPQALFDNLDREFGFTLDPCASPNNAKTERYFTRNDNGLSRSWSGVVFMNPPYGRQIGDWVHKAYRESQVGCTVVCLIAARTDTSYWHDVVMHASEVRFIRGRLKFEPDTSERRPTGCSGGVAPFPSCVVVFRPGAAGPPVISSIAKDGTALHRRPEVTCHHRPSRARERSQRG